MKHVLTFFLAASAFFNASAQCNIKLYTQTFSQKDIQGAAATGCNWLLAAENQTEMIQPPNAVGSLNELLGSYYTTKNFYSTKPLLNMELDANLPILDSIDFDFYRSYSFMKVLDNQFKSDPKYIAFKKAFKNAPYNVERRKILYDDDNVTFRQALEATKYGTFKPDIPFALTTKISKEFKLGITAKIVEEIKKTGKINADIAVNIKDSVEKYVDVTGGVYSEVRLIPDYVTTAKRILSKFASQPSGLEQYSDNFTEQLKPFLNASNASIITGAAILQAKLNYTKFMKLTTSIGSVIAANLDIADKAEAPKIAADISAKFTQDKTGTVQVNTAQTYYAIRYGYSNDLELGKGAH